jgi:hypothetical protein
MCIWNKVLVGLIGVAALALFYMSAWAYKMQAGWSLYAQQHETRISQLKEANRNLEPEVRQLDMDVHKLLVDRRRMWSKCDAKVKTAMLGPNEGTAEVAVAVTQTVTRLDRQTHQWVTEPVAHGIAKGAVLYAFEEANVQNKGQYLGEFSVKNVGEKQVNLVNTGRLSPREVDKLSKAKRAWVLYEIMPYDNHAVFASLSDDEKKAMLPGAPAERVREYVKDGKPAEKDDPAENVVGGNYVRPLLDYNVLFNNERENRMLLLDSIEAVKQDKQLVQEALAEARTQADACTKDIASTTKEKERLQQERDVVNALRKKLEKSLDAMEAWIVRLTEINQAMAGQIAKYQLEAAQRIDQRTRAMAQSGAGRQ